MGFQITNNLWQNFLLSNIYKDIEDRDREMQKIVAYRDDGDLIILSKERGKFDIRGFDTKTRCFFKLSTKESERAYKLLTRTDTTQILNPDVWEEFKRIVALDELSRECEIKNDDGEVEEVEEDETE